MKSPTSSSSRAKRCNPQRLSKNNRGRNLAVFLALIALAVLALFAFASPQDKLAVLVTPTSQSVAQKSQEANIIPKALDCTGLTSDAAIWCTFDNELLNITDQSRMWEQLSATGLFIAHAIPEGQEVCGEQNVKTHFTWELTDTTEYHIRVGPTRLSPDLTLNIHVSVSRSNWSKFSRQDRLSAYWSAFYAVNMRCLMVNRALTDAAKKDERTVDEFNAILESAGPGLDAYTALTEIFWQEEYGLPSLRVDDPVPALENYSLHEMARMMFSVEKGDMLKYPSHEALREESYDIQLEVDQLGTPNLDLMDNTNNRWTAWLVAVKVAGLMKDQQ